MHSIGLLLSPLLAPIGTKNAAWALGNVESCEFIGFILNIGICGVPFYTAFLALYFDQRVRKKVTPKEFANGVEKSIHIVLWIYPLAGGIYGLVKDYFNPVGKGNMCTFADQPFNCSKKNNLVECERAGRSAKNWRIVYQTFIPYTVALFIMVISFTRLTLHVYRQEKMFQPSKVNSKNNSSLKTKEISSLELKSQLSSNQTNSEIVVSIEEGGLEPSSQQNAPRTYHLESGQVGHQGSPLAKKALVQSLLYISVYFLTYAVPMVISYTSIAGISRLQNGDILLLWRSIVWPLGGIFNVFIYTRPKIEKLRKRDEYQNSSWFKLFWKVITSGGEVPRATKPEKPIVKTSEKPNKLGSDEQKQYDELDQHQSMEREMFEVSGKELQEDSESHHQGNRKYYNSSQLPVDFDDYEDFDIFGEIPFDSFEQGEDSNNIYGVSSIEEADC
ncbi:hypothetical protein CTEN210_13293 [Chaetoceros tenuissimus]|uniref:Uncharacterized protein n=1 Tax=Chaetoceros tenuissimus TaxID=426638 RepID=A0AAD3D2S4_9STRA|nr:hypothetical protein CTEN210_13293 [Chaetoceros tenuissimus]